MRKTTGLAFLLSALAVGGLGSEMYRNKDKEALNLSDYVYLGICLTALGTAKRSLENQMNENYYHSRNYF